jgi:hypothetical protein
MDKLSLSKAFSTHLIEFLDEVTIVFPKNVKIRTFKSAVKQVKSVNPSKLIKTWYNLIATQFKEEIYSQDYRFFEQKDYSNDLKNSEWDANDIYEFIDEMKRSSKNMSIENKKKSMKYLSNLTKMSEMYHNQ